MKIYRYVNHEHLQHSHNLKFTNPHATGFHFHMQELLPLTTLTRMYDHLFGNSHARKNHQALIN